MYWKICFKLLALLMAVATMAWLFTGPFQVLINMPSTFAVAGAIVLAVITVLGGGRLIWRLLTSLSNQIAKG